VETIVSFLEQVRDKSLSRLVQDRKCSSCGQPSRDYEVSTSRPGLFGNKPRLCYRCSVRYQYELVWREHMRWAGASLWDLIGEDKEQKQSGYLFLETGDDPYFDLHVNLDKQVWSFRMTEHGETGQVQGQGLEALERTLGIVRQKWGGKAAGYKTLGGLVTLRRPNQVAVPDPRKR
jgi:hypothetical protein